MIAGEQARTLRFDLNQDPKYDTCLVCGGTLEIFVEPVLPHMSWFKSRRYSADTGEEEAASRNDSVCNSSERVE